MRMCPLPLDVDFPRVNEHESAEAREEKRVEGYQRDRYTQMESDHSSNTPITDDSRAKSSLSRVRHAPQLTRNKPTLRQPIQSPTCKCCSCSSCRSLQLWNLGIGIAKDNLTLIFNMFVRLMDRRRGIRSHRSRSVYLEAPRWTRAGQHRCRVAGIQTVRSFTISSKFS